MISMLGFMHWLMTALRCAIFAALLVSESYRSIHWYGDITRVNPVDPYNSAVYHK